VAVGSGSSRFFSRWRPGDGAWERLIANGAVPKDARTLRVDARAKNGSLMEVGGSALWIEPALHSGRQWIALGALVLCLAVGLLISTTRRAAFDVLRRELQPASSGTPLDGVRPWLSPESIIPVAD